MEETLGLTIVVVVESALTGELIVEVNMKVTDTCAVLYEAVKSSTPRRVKLLLDGKVLDDVKTIGELGINDRDHVLVVAMGLLPSGHFLDSTHEGLKGGSENLVYHLHILDDGAVTFKVEGCEYGCDGYCPYNFEASGRIEEVGEDLTIKLNGHNEWSITVEGDAPNRVVKVKGTELELKEGKAGEVIRTVKQRVLRGFL